MTFHCMRPELLWLLLPAALLTLLLWRAHRRGGGWSAVIAPALLPYLVTAEGPGRQRSALPLIGLGWLLAVVAASGPSWEQIPQPVLRKQDALVVLLDLSASMKAADLAPSRNDRVRQKVLDLLEQRREGQTGVVAYAGDAHVVTPLTDDTGTIANLLPALHPDMMPLPGSDAAAAVREGLELLHSAGIREGDLLLITDGVSARDSDAVLDALRGSTVRLAILGVGTATGAPIPLPRGGFLRDGDGAIVMPGLQPRALRDLAAASGGRYRDMRIDNSDLDALLAPRGAVTGRGTVDGERRADTWSDMGYLFLLPLLPLVLALFRRGWLLALVPVLLFAQPPGARAGPWENLWLTPDQRGQRALQAGDADRAAELFERPDWAGTAAYRGGDYAAAAEHFARADDADALYNRGNALARAGRLDDAIAAYEASLAQAPGREDARRNLELVEALRDQQQARQDGSRQEQPPDPSSGEQDPPPGEQAAPGQGRDEPPRGDQEGSAPQDPGETGGERDSESREAADAENAESQPDPSRDQVSRDAAGSEQQRDATGAAERPPAEQGTAQQQDARDGARAGAAQAPDAERDQALEQWLRRVPDDPSGLLREKFRYESQQRERAGDGEGRRDAITW